jgi:hypothetical protein
MPRKIIFCHFGKSAGVWINTYLKAMLRRRGYVVRDPRDHGLHREWVGLELSQIRRLKLDLVYVAQDRITMTLGDVAAFRAAGFFTMTFLHHPGDLICSLYADAKRDIDEGRGNPFAGHFDVTTGSLDEWARHCLGPARRLWALPIWIDELHHVEEYCEANFASFIDKHFGQNYDPTALPFDRQNQAKAKGWTHHVTTGGITAATANEIAVDIDFRRYQGRVKF